MGSVRLYPEDLPRRIRHRLTAPLAAGLLLATLVPAVAAVPTPRLRPPMPTLATTALAIPTNPAPSPAKVAPVSSVPVTVTDEVGRKVAAWQAAFVGRGLPSTVLADVLKTMPDWPAQSVFRARYEQAIVREAPGADAVIAALAGRPPLTPDATLLLARALADKGRGDDAATVIRDFWRTQDFSEASEKTILARFGSVLTPADHAVRVDRLLYEENTTAALRTAKLLGPGPRAIAEARAAVVRQSATRGKLLDAVPVELRSDPGYVFSRAQDLRRSGKFSQAANLILAAPTDPRVLGDPDAWSEERRELARRFIDIGDPWTAYSLVNHASAASQTPRVEAEFDAGWYALDYMHQPAMARPHFEAILGRSRTPISQARGAYWLGRAAEAEGNLAEAMARYEQAARFPIAFYGQVAAARLGAGRLPLAAPTTADASTTSRFASRELVQALVALRDSGQDDLAEVFYPRIAATLTDPAEFTLLAALAGDARLFSTVVDVGKAAQAKGIAVGTLGFPDNALPPYSGPAKIELPVLFAVARQESQFDPNDVSSAGAVGMFQVMPQYARETAEQAGIPYVKAKVKADPVYNMQLGAAELSSLIADYDGSYLLAFAGYNAGRGRVKEWIRLNGDPRDPRVDPLDWIERIPFDETRNYVQRVLENLGVYRAMRGDPVIRIITDMRGRNGDAGKVAAETPRTSLPPSPG